ncbi:MAG: SCO family protein [Gammaproteobacteria bacterium]
MIKVPILNSAIIRILCIYLSLCFWFSGTASAIDIMEEKDDGVDLMKISLVNTQGETVQLGGYDKKFILLNFMFTSCHDVCPIQTASLAQLQKKLSPSMSSDMQFVSLTLDPENDTPEKLLKNASKYDIDRNSWSFLTGDPELVRYITLRFSATRDEDKADLKEHSPRIFLLDIEGNLLLSYPSTPLDVDRVLSDLQGFN